MMIDFTEKTLIQIRDGIKNREFTAEEVVRFFAKQCELKKDLNAMIEVFDDAIEKAKEIDKKIANGERVGILAGVPIAIKDNIMYKGKKMGCASKFMQDFVSPYSSTVVEKLDEEDAIIFGRTNMDEFAMGSSCEKSCYGVCHNAIDPTRVAGGSSGGSAVAVAAGLVPCALGTDTGGSIRQPASLNGVVGVKPTYGTVSRYGIVAFASSLDQCAPIAKTVSDCQLVLKVIAGRDEHDGTTIVNKFTCVQKSRYKLGVCKQVMETLKKSECHDEFYALLQKLNEYFDIVQVDIPHIQNSLACYYIIAPAEATSNLARFDGVKYTTRKQTVKDLENVYVQSRSEGFGKEVKRRIMLGNFVLSSGYFDAYYNKAKQVQRLIKSEFKNALQFCDCIIMPTTSGVAFKIGEKTADPIAMYHEDLYTVPANITGLPAISVPFAEKDGLPLGVQFYASEKEDTLMFEIVKEFEKMRGEQ